MAQTGSSAWVPIYKRVLLVVKLKTCPPHWCLLFSEDGSQARREMSLFVRVMIISIIPPAEGNHFVQ